MDVGMKDITAILRRENYCLMTNTEGVELYDEKGNLLVCKAESGECMPVANIEAVRRLYDLSVGEEDKKKGEILSIKTVESLRSKNNTIILQANEDDSDEDENPMVWLGQRTQRCQEATKALIDLFDSPKYQKMMNDRSTIKLKVWEKIAIELEAKGFRIANTVKEAGLRTFQKWRNMERTYWKYLRDPKACGEDKRRKKPSFFDDMHKVISKRKKCLEKKESESSQNEEMNNSSTVCEMDMEEITQDNTNEDAGLKFADSRMEEDDFSKKCTFLEKPYLKHPSQPRTLYTPSLRKSLLLEMMRKKPETLTQSDDMSNSGGKRLKGGEIDPNAIEALLKIIDSDRYQELFTGGGKKTRIWEKIFDEIEDMGFFIAGDTRREKIQRLFQKWRNMKRAFVKYQIGKDRGSERKRPLYYDLLLKIISKDVFGNPSTCQVETPNPSDYMEGSHLDHDYEATRSSCADVSEGSSHINSLPFLSSSPEATPQSESIEEQITTSQNTLPNLCLPDFSTLPQILPKASTSRSSKILSQIKTLHESALAIHQQNFSKLFSLLEEQINQQKTLNYLFTQYVTNLTKKRKSDHDSKSSKTDEFMSKSKSSRKMEESGLSIGKYVLGK